MVFRNITFEMSLKPFRDTSDATRDAVCRRLFLQWLALTRHAEGISVLLWSADGSEILDYAGRLDDTFEWACWQGVANPRRAYDGDDPESASLHARPRPYMDNPPTFTYAWLRGLVAALRDIGRRETGLPVRVGATFDPGPEFARSEFKYVRHPEVCLGDTMGQASMVCCYATLEGDRRAYAGFPVGIPDGTAFGTFLGRQTQHFVTDLGFDYLWLSNGFGFGLETWGLKGAVFDGQAFSQDRCEEVRGKSLGFWTRFREQCPDVPLETRGTNLSTAMDLSSDAVPLRDIYASVSSLLPPPNSPWAALNGDFGLELVGWMSHIAEIPGPHYPFRFYTHDPWFLNSPWLDRYQREPHDIYLPLSVSRIDAEGRTMCPTDLQFLTVDDSWGRMPDQVPNEVIPHILAARGMAPDAPGPFVWVYPFDEYHERTFGEEQRIDEVFFGDWFMRGAVNHGLPLNTVVSTRSALDLLSRNAQTLAGSALVTPVPDDGGRWAAALQHWVESGGDLLLYGPLAHAPHWLLEALDVTLGEPLEGEVDLQGLVSLDSAPASSIVRHHALLSAGGLAAVPGESGAGQRLLLRQGREMRLGAATAAVGNGRLVWVRGTVSCDPRRMGGHLLVPYDPREVFPAEALMRWAAGHLGWRIRHGTVSPDQPGPMLCVSRHLNGFVFAGFARDTTVPLGLDTDLGVPLLAESDARLDEGVGWYHMPRAWMRECRVFVAQQEGRVSCRTRRSAFPAVRRRLEVTGLTNASVRIFPESGTTDEVTITSNAPVPCLGAARVPCRTVTHPLGTHLLAENVTGQIMISW